MRITESDILLFGGVVGGFALICLQYHQFGIDVMIIGFLLGLLSAGEKK